MTFASTISRINPADIQVLVLEDEIDLREAVVSYLILDDYRVHGVDTASQADAWLKNNTCDVVLLDLGLPDVDGLTWLSRQRGLGNTGIIATTARAQNTDRILGAKSGVDIYLVKPVQLEELSLVILNLVRRIKANSNATWVLSKKRWSILAPSGATCKLTRLEMQLLTQFVAQPGAIISRQSLDLSLGYGPDDYDPRRLEILIRRLRQKALTNLNVALPLETVHKQGFVFTADLDEEA